MAEMLSNTVQPSASAKVRKGHSTAPMPSGSERLASRLTIASVKAARPVGMGAKLLVSVINAAVKTTRSEASVMVCARFLSADMLFDLPAQPRSAASA